MTDFARLVKGGETEEAAVVSNKPEESELYRQILPVDGKAAMPKGKPPLSEADRDVIRRWIEAGAVNDSPPQSGPQFSQEHPPEYSRPPVITSVDFSSDGKWLAVAGFHEVLLVETTQWQTQGRLVGLSERIESVRFSPDGKRLLVTGGLPGRMGEIQVWDVAEQKLQLSIPVTYDTVYGGSWSPDGKLIAFGCADKTVRALDSETGEQKLFQGAHEDWIRSTVFIPDGTHLLSAGRDMTVKLTEVATERFIDNITSITPGALRGGVNALAMHPERTEVVVGGSDGQPKIYRVFRVTERRIGDDANLIRKLPPMIGRVFDVAVSRSGKYLAAVSTLDNKSQVRVWEYDLESKLPDDIKAIHRKRAQERNDAERAKLDQFVSAELPLTTDQSIEDAAVYCIAFGTDDKVAFGMADGRVRIIKAQGGETIAEIRPAPVKDSGNNAVAIQPTSYAEQLASAEELRADEKVPEGLKLLKLSLNTDKVTLSGPIDYRQILVTAELSDGSTLDVTRIAEYRWEGNAASLEPRGVIRPVAPGESKLHVQMEGHKATVEVSVLKPEGRSIDFIHDVNPVLSRLGCNQGTCHGAAKGKNGFKLSLRGYDAIFDVRAFADDYAGRRVNAAAPDSSLMLLKALGTVPHEGGKLLRHGDVYHSIIRDWIGQGCPLNLETPRVVSIQVTPKEPVVSLIGLKQQVSVLATYSNGLQRDVTQEAFIESSNTEVASVDRFGLLTAIRRGEAAILARYEGAYDAATLTVMGKRDGFQWEQPETWGRVDELVADKWQRMKIRPSELCSDADFLRRIYLDLTGLPPAPQTVRDFLADSRPTKEKREAVIDQLIGNEAFVELWTNKWADLLQVNSKFLGVEGAKSLREWIRKRIAENTPYDQFAMEILTAKGSNKENPAASYYKILRTPEDTMENTTHLFLGVRFNCNKCHDHPFERWTQDQYYQTAAYFARVGLKRDPASGDKNIGGTAVEGAKPLYEEVFEKPDGEVTHERTGKVTPPKFPYDCEFKSDEKASRREELATWMTSPSNHYFAKSYVNRLWGYLLGTGLIEPIDDIRASNPPTNPALLDYLTKEFIQSGFNVRHIMRLICTSRTYQLSVASNEWNVDDKTNYSHAMPRRLPAEVLYDAIHAVVGSKLKIPGVPEGTRAAALPDVAINLPDGFLTNLGRPARESACECERSGGLQLGPVMALASGPTVGQALSDQSNSLQELVKSLNDRTKLIDELYLRILNRFPTDQERTHAQVIFAEVEADHHKLKQQLAEREGWWSNERPKLEARRLEELAQKEKELADTRERVRPELERLTAEREERIKQSEVELKKYETEELPKQADALYAKAAATDWHLLTANKLDATGKKTTLVRNPDRSITASGDADKGVYTIVTTTPLTEITALRLEALASDELPAKGPGLASNGNFVVTEIELLIPSTDDPKKLTPVAFGGAVADFSQENFGPDQAIDGQQRDQRGWAVSPTAGIGHWAVFRLKEPLKVAAGTTLQIKIHQFHNAEQHRLGRFRLGITNQSGEVPLGLSEEFSAIASVKDEQRTPAQKELVQKYVQQVDKGLRDQRAKVAEAKKPVPPNAEVVALEKKVTTLKQETPEDRLLVRLRNDMAQSEKQLNELNLTAAQDLAWALINSPAFLFNR